VHIHHEDDDSVVIHARLPAEVGELVERAIERAAELADGDICNEPGEPDFAFSAEGRRRAEGLRLLAQQFLSDADRESSTSGDRYQVVVHVEQKLLAEGASRSAALCEIENGPALAIETVRRLGCDGSLVGVVENEHGEPLNIGRKTRSIPIAIRRALKARDGGCRFPGCAHTRFTEGHHIQHWADGGETRLENLVTLCHFHHHLIHEGGYEVERAAKGEFLFKHPQGFRLDDCRVIDECFRGNISPHNRESGVQIDPDTIVTRWDGERMDYGMAIEALVAAKE
jgi:hypothetical protein